MRYRPYVLIGLVIGILACNMPSPAAEETLAPVPTPTVSAAATETSLPTEQPPAGTNTMIPLPATKTPSAASATATSVTATSPESATSEPPKHGALVYETQFGQGWPPLTGDKANGKMASGGYQIDITQPWALYAFTTRARQSTFFAEITASTSQCPAGHGGYGMIFHYQSDTSFRFVTIWCSGRFSLMERTGGTSTVTLSEGILPQGVDPAKGEHIVSIRAFANKLTAYVDGKQITQVDVTTLPTGDVGPYAETIGDPLTVLFKRLAVYAAE